MNLLAIRPAIVVPTRAARALPIVALGRVLAVAAVLASVAVPSLATAETRPRYIGTGGTLGDQGFRRDGLRIAGGLVLGTAAGWVTGLAAAAADPTVERSLGWNGAWVGYELVSEKSVLLSLDLVAGTGGSCIYATTGFDGCRRLEAFVVAESSANLRVEVTGKVALTVSGGYRFVANAPSFLAPPAAAFGAVSPADSSRRLIEGAVASIGFEVYL